jgi:hypothetical protein
LHSGTMSRSPNEQHLGREEIGRTPSPKGGDDIPNPPKGGGQAGGDNVPPTKENEDTLDC